jgi:hypothetical protein
MAEDSLHLRLQQQIDCNLDTNPWNALEAWEAAGWKDEPGTDVDEAPLKYLSLVLLDAVSNRSLRLALDKDAGVVEYGDTTRTLPQAPAHYIARGLEILRDITGIDGPQGEGKLALGVRNESLEVILQKDKGKHTITIPGVADI